MHLAFASADFGIPVFGGKGASVHIQEMIRGFARSGHRVTLVSPQIADAPVDFPATIHRASTGMYHLSDTDMALAAKSDRIFKERRNLAIAAGVEKEVLQLHRQHPFDAIYERYSLWSAAGVRVARKLGIPVAVEVNAPLLQEQEKYRTLLLADEAAKIEHEVFSGADLIFAVSNEMRDYVVSNGGHAGKTFVQPNGVDIEQFSATGPLANTGIPDGRTVIGFSGSLKAWHGIENLVEAFAGLCKRNLNCHLLVVGEGPLRGWIEGYARGAGLGDRITVTGWQSHETIPAFIRCMDVAVAPYPEVEGFYFSPLKLAEYMSCGRAVVASGIGQISETIADGVNGKLCRAGSVEDLMSSIQNLVIDRSARERLASEAVKTQSANSWTQIAHHVGSAIESLGSKRRREAAL